MSRRSGTLQLTTPMAAGEIVFRLGKVVAVFRDEARYSVGEGLIDAGLCDVMQYQEMLTKQKEGVVGGALFAAFGLTGEGLDTTLEELLKRAVYGMFEWKEGTFSFVLEDQPDPWRGFTIDGARVVVERGLNPQYLAIEGARLRDEHSKDDPVEEFMAKQHDAAPPLDATGRRADEDFSQLQLETAAPILPEKMPQLGPGNADADKIIPFPAGRGRREAPAQLAMATTPPDAAAGDAAQSDSVMTGDAGFAPASDPHRAAAAGAGDFAAGPQDAAAQSAPAAPEFAAASQPMNPAAELAALAELAAKAAPAEAPVHGADPSELPELPDPTLDEPNAGSIAAAGPVSPWALLVVDDDAQVLTHLLNTFAPRFSRVLTAASVPEALAHLQQNPGQLVVATDLIISRSDNGGILGGIEILEQVRKLWPQTPVLLFTDYQNEEAQVTATRLGVSAQLMKPRKAQIYGDGRGGLTPPMRDFIGRLDTHLAPYITASVPLPRMAPEHYDLRSELASQLNDPNTVPDVAVPVSIAGEVDMLTLRSMIAELRDPSSRDAVTLLVLRFASSLFERGALFLATRRAFVGLGGFSHAEASDQFVVRVRHLQVPVELESLLSKVARFQALVREPLEDTAGNRRLLTGLGGEWHHNETVAAPLISGDRVAAILFGDNPSTKPLGNTDGLEIFMQQAGLVMERALLERKLEESRQKDPTKK